jgi:hypothetical protein
MVQLEHVAMSKRYLLLLVLLVCGVVGRIHLPESPVMHLY